MIPDCNGSFLSCAGIISTSPLSHGHKPVFFRRQLVALIGGYLQSFDDSRSDVSGIDNIVHMLVSSGVVRIHVTVEKLLEFYGAYFFRLSGFGYFFTKENVNCAFGPHETNFRCRQRKNKIRAQVLAAHRKIAAGIGLAQHDGDFRDRCFGESVEHFCAVANDALAFHIIANKKSGNVLQTQEWDVERVAEANEAGALVRRIDIETACKMLGIIGYYPHCATVQTGEADNEVRSELLFQLEKVTVIHNAVNDFADVVGDAGLHGNDFRQLLLPPRGIIAT